MVQLGALYSLGSDVVSQSDKDAALWYEKAADLKNPAAMYDLAGLYETGQGVARDVNKARELYQASAALGNIEARRRLSELGGRIVPWRTETLFSNQTSPQVCCRIHR